jgi:hypothetical protein
LRATAAAISIHASGVDTLLNSYTEQADCTIDELGERVGKYSRDLRKRLHVYTSDADRLVTWLIAATPHADEYVAQVIALTIKDIQGLQKRVGADMDAAIRRLEELHGNQR